VIKFEISYPGGTTHEVELSGSVVVLGRDPGCDLVLNDTKCSRRHAVVEEGPEGVVVRDTASANGVHVNGRRVEKAPLRPGDVLRLGEVQLKLVEQIGETVVMAPEDLEFRTTAGTPRPPEVVLPLPESLMVTPRPPERPAPVRPPAAEPRRPPEPRPPADTRTIEPRPWAAARPARPATVTVLVALWAVFVPVSVAACLFAAYRLGGGAVAWTIGGLASLVLAALGTIMALGLRALAPWARHLQVATGAFGLLVCPFTLASATVLLYLTRRDVKAAFEGGHGRGAGDGAAEATFALSLLGMLGLGMALAAAAVLVL
jgi:type III secretion system (T3SS) inner membrane Yop/YscD-like protein